MRAVKRRALRLPYLMDCVAANSTGLARAAISKILLLKIA
jgi:hypothetical protein